MLMPEGEGTQDLVVGLALLDDDREPELGALGAREAREALAKVPDHELDVKAWA